MNKSELIERVAKQTGLTKKDCMAVVNAMTDAISQELRERGKIQLTGFGSFEVKHREGRTGRDPQTNQAVEIAAKDVPVFRPGKALKDSVNAD